MALGEAEGGVAAPRLDSGGAHLGRDGRNRNGNRLEKAVQEAKVVAGGEQRGREKREHGALAHKEGGAQMSRNYHAR